MLMGFILIVATIKFTAGLEERGLHVYIVIIMGMT
jgi:hypothetical protein